MLLSETATVIWNARNKSHYIDCGYTFTKMGDEFVAQIEHLTKGSQANVVIKCDYCGCIYYNKWDTYRRVKKRELVHTDACWSCCEVKSEESIAKKYGSHKEMYSASNSRRIQTNVERYGSENVFGSELIKQRIVETNLERYGVPYTQQCDEVRQKTVETCRNKYGVDNYVELFKGKFIGENSPVWKSDALYQRHERATHEYISWRTDVFCRDEYTCQCCGARNGGGAAVILNAHHVLNWKDNPESRYDVSNGITLCQSCHTRFHSIYGKHLNNRSQLDEFICAESK